MNSIATNMVVVPDIAGPVIDRPEEGQVLSISEMSDLFDVTLRALRFYEEKGLLTPIRRGARRFYGATEVSRMRIILQAKKIGLTLVEIRKVISLVEGEKPRQSQFEELKTICETQQSLLHEQKVLLDEQVSEVDELLVSLDRLVHAG
ncbi:MerR family transcriptional regulator [Roseibium limicola]|nr:MerR family transcriptional regulator [Roseibium limicola]